MSNTGIKTGNGNYGRNLSRDPAAIIVKWAERAGTETLLSLRRTNKSWNGLVLSETTLNTRIEEGLMRKAKLEVSLKNLKEKYAEFKKKIDEDDPANTIRIKTTGRHINPMWTSKQYYQHVSKVKKDEWDTHYEKRERLAYMGKEIADIERKLGIKHFPTKQWLLLFLLITGTIALTYSYSNYLKALY